MRQRSLFVMKGLAIRAASLFLVVVAPTALGQEQVSAAEKDEVSDHRHGAQNSAS
jgi:hypothetical protein